MASDKSSSDRIIPTFSRRDLFRTVGLATGGAILLGLPKVLGSWTAEAEAAVQASALSTVRVALELDGAFMCFLNSVEGGNAFADIVPEAVGPDAIQRKRPGPARFEDIVVEVGIAGVAAPLSGWITEMLAKFPTPKNGAIVYTDMNYKEVKRLEFSNAILTEVTVLASTAAEGKKPAALALRITPQATRLAGSTGKVLAVLGVKNKNIVSGNFRFNVQGLEKSCGRVSKVDPIVARRVVTGTAVGQDRLKQSVPGVLDCSIVRIALPEADAGPFYQWFDDMVLNGKNGAERAGLLEWLDPTLTTVLASI
ncbi:MAG: hypothetical protein ABIR36_07240 [Nitrospiraceae bacterium]